MKKNLAILFCCLIAMNMYAQSDNITIGLVMPNQQRQIDERAFRLLETKMLNLMTTTGVSSMQNGNFIMYPVVNVLNNELIEGGMRNMVRVEIELSMYISQYSTQTSYGSFSKTLKGSGKNLSDAVRDAFAKIQSSDKGFADFMAQSKDKIIRYYTGNQKAILAKAKALASSKQYEEAIALLYTYPSAIEGSSVMLAEAVNVYKQYQDAICSQWIQKAQGAIALQDYMNAIELLSQIDSESRCRKEAISLIDQVKMKIQDDIEKQERLAQKEQEMLINLEKHRIDAIKEIAVAYCKNQPTITYTQIIK